MFRHLHPYEPFIPIKTKTLIIGTIPPPRFSNGPLFEEDVDFCYGSKYGLLWPLIDKIYNLQLEFKNNVDAVQQRKAFLTKYKIGICDMVESCERKRNDASDLGMENILLRDLLFHLKKNPIINLILFMGGNSKNGPEYLFRKILRKNSIQLKSVSNESPKIHKFNLKNKTIKTISLISPSNAANRSIGANPLYKKFKLQNTSFNTFDFRYLMYKKYFLNLDMGKDFAVEKSDNTG